MKIHWTTNPDGTRYGIDDAGNQFWVTANREVTTVETADGRLACGWDVPDALRNAQGEHHVLI